MDMTEKPIKKSMKSFLIIWVGQLISSIGSGLTAFSLGIYAFQKTHEATGYSLMILWAFLPAFLLKPIGGVWADRHDRRRMMILGDLGSGWGLMLVLLALALDGEPLWPVYAGVAVSSLFVAVQNPAYKAAITDLVGEEDYGRASGMMQMAESSRFLISPIIAGFLLRLMDIQSVILVDIMTFVAAAVAASLVKMPGGAVEDTGKRGSFWEELREGTDFLWGHQGVRMLLIIVSVVTFFVGFLQSLIGPMLLCFTDEKTLGVLQTMVASGMLAGGMAMGMLPSGLLPKSQVNILAVSLSVAGICYAFQGLSTYIPWLFVCGFLFFVMLPFINTSLDVLIRKNVPNEIQGRVWSMISLISQMGMAVAFASAGVLADCLFNPLLWEGGGLASTAGLLVGVGPGRGIGLMFVLSGILVTVIGIVVPRFRMVRNLEGEAASERG